MSFIAAACGIEKIGTQEVGGTTDVPSVEESLHLPHQMLIRITLGKPLVQATAADVELLKRSVAEHGAVALVGDEPVTPSQLKAFVEKWGEVLLLPDGLAFNSRVTLVPEVARVGNVKKSGSIVHNHSAAEYWHHDGDFWDDGQHHILNFLQSVLTPSLGGQTGFLDMHRAYLMLSAQQKQQLKGAYTVVHAGDIKDFQNLPENERPGDVWHEVLMAHPETGRMCLYLPDSSTGIQGPDGQRIGDSKDFIEAVCNDPQQGVVPYQWTEGDMLIWDNTQTMHCSLGGYLDEGRLLQRCQARLAREKHFDV